MASAGEDVQITCRFVTRLPEKFRIAPTPLAVPGALTRYGLSEVVNHLLALDPPKPFDFLVDGELVRTSLRKLLLRKAISAEKTLDVEYIPAVGPPAETSVGKHEDWISAVDGGFAGAIATGCYDGTVGCGRRAARGCSQWPCRTPRTTRSPRWRCCRQKRDGDGTNHRLALVAGAHDGVARLWDATFSGKRASANAPGLRGHTAAIAEIAAAPGGDRFATASSDGTARVWRREGGAEHDFAAEADAPPRRAPPPPPSGGRPRRRRRGTRARRRAREVVPGLRRRRGRRRRAARAARRRARARRPPGRRDLRRVGEP